MVQVAGTENSFAIELESPSEDKARMFIAVLHQAQCGAGVTYLPPPSELVPVAPARCIHTGQIMSGLDGKRRPSRVKSVLAETRPCDRMDRLCWDARFF